MAGARREAEARAGYFAAVGVTVVPKPFDIDALLGQVRRRLA